MIKIRRGRDGVPLVKIDVEALTAMWFRLRGRHGTVRKSVDIDVDLGMLIIGVIAVLAVGILIAIALLVDRLA